MKSYNECTTGKIFILIVSHFAPKKRRSGEKNRHAMHLLEQDQTMTAFGCHPNVWEAANFIHTQYDNCYYRCQHQNKLNKIRPYNGSVQINQKNIFPIRKNMHKHFCNASKWTKKKKKHWILFISSNGRTNSHKIRWFGQFKHIHCRCNNLINCKIPLSTDGRIKYAYRTYSGCDKYFMKFIRSPKIDIIIFFFVRTKRIEHLNMQ